MLNLVSLFEAIGSEKYCIIKVGAQFPAYETGDDIDIFCYEPNQAAGKILEWGGYYLSNGLDIRVNTEADYNYISVAFVEGGKMHCRFNLFGQLPKYKKLLIKDALFESVIEHSRFFDCQHNEECVKVRIPSEIDDLILRYIEFIEWYNVRPDEIKHLDYIMDKIDDEKKIEFLDKLHHYTALPSYSSIKKQRKCFRKRVSTIFKKLIKRFKF